MIRQNMTRREVESIGKTLPRYQLVRVLNTFDLYVDNKDRSVAGCLARDGYWESWITSWMTKNIQTQWNCLDAGANFGYYTGIMSELAPEGKVVAVEANPTIAKLLNKSVKHNGWTNVQVIGYALGEKNSKKNLIIEDDLQIGDFIVDLNAIDYVYLGGYNEVVLNLNSGKSLVLSKTGHGGIREILREYGRLE